MTEPGISRRRLFGAAGAGALLAAGTGYAAGRSGGGSGTHTDSSSPSVVPFYGDRQSGIATPVQDRLHFAAFDVTTSDRGELAELLRVWTAAAARMTAGDFAGPDGAFPAVPESPPQDTGEAAGLPAARLTVTIGFGPALFERGGTDRFGLRAARPAALVDLPHFPGDALDQARSHGDIAIQACADDPQVAVHAIRNLARIGFGVVGMRWSQLGFGKTSSTTPAEQTPRNLFGFKDGTNNIAGDQTRRLANHVWVGTGDGPDWMTGGSYLVARRIAMRIETWDRTSLAEQQQIIGRDKREGAPLGSRHERDVVAITKLPPDSHVALANPSGNAGLTILRRGYSFVDGSDELGRINAGLFFLAYQRDPREQFIPLQRKLAAQDRLNEYIQHTGSGIWACPPGVRDQTDWWGRALFG